MFDLICGTSTGGLLAIALGIYQLSHSGNNDNKLILGLGKKTLAECEELYTAVGGRVFVPKSLQLFGKAKYSGTTLESVLKEQFQEARMDDARTGPKVRQTTSPKTLFKLHLGLCCRDGNINHTIFSLFNPQL